MKDIEGMYKRFEERWDYVMRGTGTGYGKNQAWLKSFIESEIDLALEQVAEKFNIPVEKLRIKD